MPTRHSGMMDGGASIAYTRPDSLEQALSALARPGARCYAGGTDLLVALHQRAPWTSGIRELVDIKGITAAAGVQDRGTHIRIGALVTASELERDPLVARFASAVAEAARRTSAPMLRARGTVGGNLMTPHAVPDVATALLAIGATAMIASPATPITAVPIDALLDRAGAGSRVAHLSHDALVVAVEIPKDARSAFEKLGTRRAFSRATVAVGVAVRAGRHRVAVSGLAERPFLATATATALDSGEDAADALARDLEPHESARNVEPGSLSDQRGLVGVLIARARDRAVRGSSAERPGDGR